MAAAVSEQTVTREEFAALALEPTYVFRIERSAMDVVAAMSFYVDLPRQSALRVVAEADDTYTLLEQPVADVIYSGLIEALGIWPDTHPELDADATPPDLEAAVETTLVVLRHTDEGIEEHELTWYDADEEGVWLPGEDDLQPTSDYALYQALPLMLAFEHR
ncbi:hypothetical protein DVA67_022780 [Solirubrobacter sp. CPCC 204708]|uniref:Uncharacterized protein n=1 Tax=Solirubrobacter deserti TaxID=2282478 RepID=A0ABT4RI22_9ACTN|nr:hypothetical protein [Solirubrobacter deserti]MBE2318819.1 hypothetical protein [Solirubrobacter deserti]MDA0138199.1 hypothetical protein [Solirubrobacter deserti]